MNKDIAKNICVQMIEDVEGLCDCPRFMEKDKSCIGCRELAIKTILKENRELQQIINKAIEYIDKLEDYPMLTRYNCLELLEILKGGNND